MSKPILHTNQKDAWHSLKQFTDARIALGSTGISMPLRESLQFKLAHAHARDAVYSQLNVEALQHALQSFQMPVQFVQSAVADRTMYLKRPDLGKRLHHASVDVLNEIKNNKCDLVIVIADGLSATAVEASALPLLQLLLPKLAHINLGSLIIASQARVAIADEIGELLNAQLSLILIGERPGLSSADSLGAYITYKPVVGLTDESRNCISNIRPDGLNYELAADKIFYLISEALRLKLSGVMLKDNAGLIG